MDLAEVVSTRLTPADAAALDAWRRPRGLSRAAALRALAVELTTAPTGPTTGPQALERLMTARAEADAATETDACDRCGHPSARLRGDLDLSGTRVPAMVIERLCGRCREQSPRWPL